jgi:hypothetical protein
MSSRSQDPQIVNPRTKTEKETDVNRNPNRKLNRPWTALVTAAALCLALAPAATAADIAQVRAGSGGLDFQPRVEYGALVLTVSGPDGFHHRAEFGAGESPAFSIFDKAGAVVPDGSYNWELSVVPSDAQRRDAFEANQAAAKSGERGGIERLVQSGSFAIVAGSVVAGGETEPGARGPQAGNVLAPKATVLTTNDGVIRNSLCVGVDCPTSPSFGFDTIRIQENNTRFHFDDTSSTGSFPANDWRLVANDSANGGRNVFYIEDSTAGREVFSVEAGAGANSIYVDSSGSVGGNVGFGTSTPVLDLHVVSGNTPALRLEQNGSSGFAAQTWDIAGNEANFFVRDVTNGSRLPFKIIPSAPTNSLYVANTGNVGIGTTSPDAAMDIERNGAGAASTLLRLTNLNGPGRLEFRDTTGAIDWDFRTTSGDTFVITQPTSPTNDFLIASNGNVTIRGTLTTAGSCSIGCDRVFSPDYDLESIEEHAASMWASSYLPAVGPTPEDGPFNLTEKTGGMLNELEKAHIYIEQLNGTIRTLEARLGDKEGDLSALADELAALRAAVEELRVQRSE